MRSTGNMRANLMHWSLAWFDACMYSRKKNYEFLTVNCRITWLITASATSDRIRWLGLGLGYLMQSIG